MYSFFKVTLKLEKKQNNLLRTVFLTVIIYLFLVNTCRDLGNINATEKRKIFSDALAFSDIEDIMR